MKPEERTGTVKTRGADRVIVDSVRLTPVDRALRAKWKRTVWVVVAIVLVVVALRIIRHFTNDKPVIHTTARDHFLYGSIGSEPGGSIFHPVGGMLPPYMVFAVLPEMFPEQLPGGYASLGLVFEKAENGAGGELPIGISRRQRLGTDLVGLNCAVCHTGTFRASVSAERRIIEGMPAHQLDLQRLFSFVISSVLDSRFTAENVIGHVEIKFGKLSSAEKIMMRASVPQVRERTLQLQARVGRLFAPDSMRWGPGRVDTFNPYKALQFNWELGRLPPDELAAASDFPSLWNQAARKGLSLHWDGNNSSLDERNLSAGLGGGITPVTADHASIARVKDYIEDLPPPRWPEGADMPLDREAASRGSKHYQERCAVCHDFGRDGMGKVVPLEQIGTDPARLNSYTKAFADNQNTLFPDSPHRFRHFRKTTGYVNQPLDGIWARAPYLHNGSVPSLAALLLLKPRPNQFYRGYDVYNAEDVGFVSSVAKEGTREFFLFKVVDDAGKPVPGNSNSGHLYGEDLPDDAKRDLLEYLKTL